jgi:stage V sporulation protein B
MKKNKSSFIKQAAILAGAGVVVRVLGFLYRLPLTAMIGDVGNGIYTIGFYIYNFFLIMSSSGLPAAISKMVAARTARGRYDEAERVFKVSLIASGALGFVCMIIIFIWAEPIVMLFSSPRSKSALLTLAPTVFIVSVMAVYRGYFQGLQNTVPTAVSQMFEQAFNAVFSVILAYSFMKAANGDAVAMGAAGGTAGTGVGAAAGLLFLFCFHWLVSPGIKRGAAASARRFGRKTVSARLIVKELFLTSFPIIIGTAIFSFSNLVDASMVKSRLAASGITDADVIEALYGQLTGKYVTITTLPVAVSTALATAAIPSITESKVKGDAGAVQSKIAASMRLAMLISIPASVGIGVLADQIIRMLMPRYPEGGAILALGSVSIIFLSLTLITTGMLQGIGKLFAPLIGAACGVLVKIPINHVLIGDPRIRVYGAVAGTIACYIVTSALGLFFLTRATGVKPDIKAALLKPLAAAAGMGAVCYLAYYLPYYVIPINAVWTLFSICVGVASYFLLLLLIKGVKKSDILLMPSGAKIAAFLERRGLL